MAIAFFSFKRMKNIGLSVHNSNTKFKKEQDYTITTALLKGQSHEIFRALLWQSSIDQDQERSR